MAGGCGASDRRRGRAGFDDPTERRIADLWRRVLVLFRFERHRSAAGRPQSRLWPGGAETLVDATAPVAGAGADRVDRPVGVSLPRRARTADRGHPRGLLSLGGAGAPPAHVPPHRDRGFDAGELAHSRAHHPARPPGGVSRYPAGRRADLRRQHRLRRAFRRLFERISAQLHFDLRGPRLRHDRARLSLLGGAAFRVRRRAQRVDHQSAPGTDGYLTQRANPRARAATVWAKSDEFLREDYRNCPLTIKLWVRVLVRRVTSTM